MANSAKASIASKDDKAGNAEKVEKVEKKEKVKKSKKGKKEGKEDAAKASLLTLYIFEILRKYSDRNAPLTSQQIREKLTDTEAFKSSTSEDRHIVLRRLHALAKHLPGLVVGHKVGGTTGWTWYYDGDKALGHEVFSRNHYTPDEVTFLVDIISSSKLMSSDSTAAICSKLLNSLNSFEKEALSKRFVKKVSYSKNPNAHLQELRKQFIDAIDGGYDVEICRFNGSEIEKIEKTSVYAINEKDGQTSVYIEDGKKIKGWLSLNRISKVRVLDTHDMYDRKRAALIEIRVDNETLDKDGSSDDAVIKSDTLFTNIRMINCAILERRYLCFKEHRLNTADGTDDEKLECVVPLATAFFNGRYYLIAKKRGKKYVPLQFRVELLENVSLGGAIPTEELLTDGSDVSAYIEKHPYMILNQKNIDVIFYIKEKDLPRVFDDFGDHATLLRTLDPTETVEGARQKLASHFPEDFHDSFIGYGVGETLVEVCVSTTEEEAIRWALQNADSVEVKSPERLRSKIKKLSETLINRYSKSKYDAFKKKLGEILSGERPLSYSGREEDRKIFERIEKMGRCGDVKRLFIEHVEADLPQELGKYTNVEEIFIRDSHINDFSFLEKFASLESLAIVRTNFEDTDILLSLGSLRKLFISRNAISDYSFLKELSGIDCLYIGRNDARDYSPLYELRGVRMLALEENVLAPLDVRKLAGNGEEHIRVMRWLDDTRLAEFPKCYRLNPTLFYR